MGVVIDTLPPALFDPESRLPGPAALLGAVRRDFAWARKHGTTIGIAVLYVPEPTADAVRAAAVGLRSWRLHQDVAARVSPTHFAIAIGTEYTGRPSATVEVVEQRLAETAADVAEAGGGEAQGRVIWLHRGHEKAEELYEEAATWLP